MSINQMNSYPSNSGDYSTSGKDMKVNFNMVSDPQVGANNNYYQGQPVQYPQPYPYHNSPIGSPRVQYQGQPPVYPAGSIQDQGQALKNQIAPGAMITINSNTGQLCQFCRKTTHEVRRKKVGCASMSWCACLFVCTGICCWIPFVIKDCYDEQIVCSGCQQVKAIVRSRYGL